MTVAPNDIAPFAYPCPQDIPTTLQCRTLSIPDDPLFIGAVMGALRHLTLEQSWQYYGNATITPAQVAAASLLMLNAAFEANACAGVDTAPYWDDPEGDDTSGNPSEGEGEPWYDQVSWWIVEGFLASTFTPAAAATFVTVVKKLRIAYLKRDFGAIFDIQIDGATVATVDSYSATPEVGYIDVVIP